MTQSQAPSLAIRLRLSNESDKEIEYITGFDAADLVGYRLYRRVGEREWKFLPKTGARNESLLLRMLVVTTPISDLNPAQSWSTTLLIRAIPLEEMKTIEEGYDEEHAFSIFVKLGSTEERDAPIELVSEAFVPLKRNK
jgi:hypothetical protein